MTYGLGSRLYLWSETNSEESQLPSPILLIAPELDFGPIVATLKDKLNAEVVVVSNRRAGLAALRRREFSLVLMDDSLEEADPHTLDILFQNSGIAPVRELDFQRLGPSRIVSEARATLNKKEVYLTRANLAAKERLKSELRGSLAALLLKSELVLREARPELRPKVKELVELADALRDVLHA